MLWSSQPHLDQNGQRFVKIPHSPEGKPKRRGPGGAHVTYREADKKLFAQMLQIVKKHHGNAVRAALELVAAGKVLGNGRPISKAHRLAKRFRDAQRGERPRARPPRSPRSATS
jgi:hypothetical protein